MSEAPFWRMGAERHAALDRPHDPRECGGDSGHCMIHHVDEHAPPGVEPYRGCLECGHLYLTGDDLLSAFNRMLDQMHMDAIRFGYEAEDSEPPKPETNPDLIWFCPFCSHDW